MRKWHPASLLPDIGGLFAVVTFIVLVLFSGGRALNDGDTYWHIAAGQRMLSERTILTSDVFSHTAAGKPWTAHEWLSEIVMAVVHNFAGFPGVCIFFFLVTSLSFWLLYIMVKEDSNEWLAVIFVSLAFVLSLNHLLARPHIFTWILGGISFFILRKNDKKIFLLPLISALWANLHGGFILGIVLQGMFLAGSYLESCSPSNLTASKVWLQKNKLLLLVFFLSITTAGINPFGFSLYLFPFHVSSKVFAQGINEWLSPNFQKQWLFRYFLLFIIFLLSQRCVATTWRDRIFLIFFINAALVHQRHISIAAFYLAPFSAKATQSWSAPILSRIIVKRQKGQNQLILSKWTGPFYLLILGIFFLCMSSQSFPKTKIAFEHLIPLPKDRFPVKAISFLSKNRTNGNMFNDYSWGGFSIYALHPHQPVFIDGRADMYGQEIFKDYKRIKNLDKSTEFLLEKYNINLIFYHTDSILIRYLILTNRWEISYQDNIATVLIRKTLNEKNEI